MKKIICQRLIFALAANSCFWLSPALAQQEAAPAKTLVAILDFELTEKVPAELRAPLTERLRKQVFDSEKYTVVNRAEMDNVLKEQGLSCSDLTTKQCQIEFGRILQVEKLITGGISKAEDSYFLTVQITDVESAKVEKLEDATCKNCGVDQLLEQIDLISENLVGEAKVTEPSKTARTGKLQIHSTPEGATVYLDSVNKGITPLTLEKIPVGVHKLVLTKEGCENVSKGVEVKRGLLNKVAEVLVAQTGTLKVETIPAGAEVFLDGASLGNSPLTKADVPVGSHTLKFEHPDYKAAEEPVKIKYQETAEVKKVLPPLPAILLVVSTPAGAEVKINGKPSGQTPLEGIQLEPGDYKVDVALNGYRTYSAKLTLTPNQKADLNASLTPGKTKPEKSGQKWNPCNTEKKKAICIGIGVAVVGGGVSAALAGGGGGGSGNGSIVISW